MPKLEFRTLRARFFLVTLLLGLVLSLPVTLLAVRQSDINERRGMTAALDSQAALMANQFELLCEDMLQRLYLISGDSSVRFWLDGPQDAYYQARWNTQSYRLMTNLTGQRDQVHYYLLRADGWQLSSDLAENASGLDPYALGKAPGARWSGRFRAPVRGDMPAFALISAFTSDAPSASYIGTAAIAANWSVVDQMLEGSTFTHRDNLLILGQQGELLYSAAPAGSIEHRAGGLVLLDGQRYLSSARALEATGWTLMCLARESTLGQLQHTARRPILLSALSQLALFVLLSAVLTGSVTRPLKRLCAIMNRADERGYQEQAPQDRTDEIGQIAASFNRMTHTMLTNHVLKRKAELSALQAQIDPHFLYNALESIKAMANERGDDGIRCMVEALGDMFRYNLNRGGQDLVSLREELEHVRNYLYMQRMRHHDRLSSLVFADDRALNRPLPRFTLQPLVENCCVHALKHTEHTLTVRLVCALEGGELVITVSDDGPGVSDEKLGELVHLVGSAGSPGSGEAHVGLMNVAQRLRLRLGGRLRLYRPPGGGFAVEIRVGEEGRPWTDTGC